MSNFREKSRLPQSEYFAATHDIPGTQWTITGHSRALERTGFWIPQLRFLFDAGVDLPTGCGARPLAIFVTHGHIDHCNALPMLLRHHEDCDPPTQIFAPATTVHRLRQFVQVSWAVKVDIGEDLPDFYEPPPDGDRNPVPGSVLEGDLPFRIWRPCDSETETVIHAGKKATMPVAVQSLKLFHGRCTSVGYLISSPPQKIKKVRPDLVGSNKKETGKNVKAARERGEEVNVEVEEPEKPHFAFVLDTTIEALQEDRSSTAKMILNCPSVMIECTYLEDAFKDEARKRGHIYWGELVPYVTNSARRKMNVGISQTWYLVHFSLRYTEEQIVDFFADEGRCKMKLHSSQEEETKVNSSPPDVVLWLDSGPKELWVRVP